MMIVGSADRVRERVGHRVALLGAQRRENDALSLRQRTWFALSEFPGSRSCGRGARYIRAPGMTPKMRSGLSTGSPVWFSSMRASASPSSTCPAFARAMPSPQRAVVRGQVTAQYPIIYAVSELASASQSDSSCGRSASAASPLGRARARGMRRRPRVAPRREPRLPRTAA